MKYPKRVTLLTAAFLLLAGLAPAASTAAQTESTDYWASAVRFPDGSAIITRGDTGAVTVTKGEAQSVTSSPAVPAYSTPDGFHLYGNNRYSWYSYQSQWILDDLLHIVNGSTTIVGRVETAFNEYIYGSTTSHRWKITMKSIYLWGPIYNYDFEYWCGVNIPNADDYTCNTHSSGSPHGYDAEWIYSGTGNMDSPWIYSIGSADTQYAKYPMIETTISWANATPQAKIKMRGWDVRWYAKSPRTGVAAGYSMAPVTGTGY